MNDLLKNDNRVLLVYPIPTPGFHVTKRLMQDVPKSTFNATEYLLKNPLTFDITDYYLKNSKTITAFDGLNHKNLIKIFPENIFCNTNTMQCNVHKGSEIYFRDDQHLAIRGAELLNEKLLLGIEKFINE